MKEKIIRVKKEISKKVVGQEEVIDKILIGLFTGNHILLEGLPGLAKSLTVNTLSEVLGTDFSRIQFTPDLLPNDIIGTQIYNEKIGEFSTKKGPIFSNIILADEINRAPAKVQSALLEAMQEKQVTIANETFKLEEPFIVLATQNPLEQDGTYPLPEAQQDRFLMKVKVEYPTRTEERQIIDLITGDFEKPSEIEAVLSKEEIIQIRKDIKKVTVDERLKDYILDIVFKTRETNKNIDCGGSPRVSISLIVASKANAYLNGRDYVIPEDIKTIVFDVLRHRIILSYEAEANEKNVEEIIKEILREVVLP